MFLVDLDGTFLSYLDKVWFGLNGLIICRDFVAWFMGTLNIGCIYFRKWESLFEGVIWIVRKSLYEEC